ncbi:MFS transporter [Selenomonadales bacterium OttesenSCG-928-I06]|nr:MFS transporter [Selenomonadales bacterium OttesenSCG-928-I06]
MNKKYMSFLSISHLSNDLPVGALPAILPFLVIQYGMDYKEVAGLVFASSFLSSIIQPIFGYIADKNSYKWFMSLGILLSCSGIAAVGFIDNYWGIFTVVMISGLGGAIFHPEAARIVHKFSGNKKGSGFSFFSVGGSIGVALGPVIVISSILAFGMHGLAIIAAIGIITSIFLMYHINAIYKQAGESPVYFINDSKEKAETQLINDWKSFSKLTVIVMGRSIIFSGLMTFIPLYWVNVLMQSNAAGGTALTVLLILGVIVTLLGGILSDKFGYKKTMIIFCTLTVPLLFLFTHTSNPIFAMSLLIPLGFSLFAPYSAMIVLGQSYLAKSVGFASGVTMGLAFSVGGMVLPGLGWVADNYSLQQAMQILGYVAIVIAIFSFLLPKPKSI